ncbi:MAG: hypothetical protein IKD70_02475, partial [Eggerthellaceae bacterium]|nr:hypothetical protein [Eggerthellaceae bacterium]
MRRFTVVGFVKSPDYISGTSLGTSSLGSGEVQQFMYVTEGAFAEDYPYTDLYVRVAGATALFAGSEDYKAHVEAVEDRIRTMVPQLAEERTARVKAPYEEDLAEAQAEYDEARADYEQGVADYEQGLADFEDGEAEYEDGKSDYESRLAQWQRAMSAYRSGLAEYNENLDYYRLARERLDDAYALAVAQLGQEMADELYARAIEELAVLKAQLDAAKSQLDSTSSQLAWAKRQLDAAAAQLADAAAELADAASQLDDAKTELDDAKAQLDDGAAQIARARQELDDMAPAEYFVLDRTKNYGAMSHEADSNRIDSIARVFPFIFFLVAALVALTTMTRMVEEERTLIGTFKALGYGKRRIISKYLIYAATASVL